MWKKNVKNPKTDTRTDRHEDLNSDEDYKSLLTVIEFSNSVFISIRYIFQANELIILPDCSLI